MILRMYNPCRLFSFRIPTLAHQRSRFLEILLFIALVVTVHAEDRYLVEATPLGVGAPLQPTAKIFVSRPPRWRLLKTPYAAGISFVPEEGSRNSQNVELSVIANVSGSLHKITKSFNSDPLNTSSLTFLKTAAAPGRAKMFGFFDTGRHGRRPIWLVRSSAYDLYLILIVREDLSIEISLRADDADKATKYLEDFKQVARSISIE